MANELSAPRIIAVAGGKGGTGKSLLAANIGIFLATLGKRVTLVDAAFGGANLHSFVGVSRPDRTLADCLAADVPLDHVVVDTRIPSLGLIAGEGDPAWAGNPKSAQVNRLIVRLKHLPSDYVVLDLGAGTAGTILDLFLVADVGIVMVIPEPTSVELGYRFLRAAFVRRLRKVGIQSATDIPADEMRLYEGGIPAPLDILTRTAEAGDSATCQAIAAEMAALRPRFVVNNVRSKADTELCDDLARAVQRRFGVPAESLGPLEYDDAVWVAVRRRQPLLIEHPESRIARCIERVVRRLLAKDKERARPLDHPETFYDLLELEPSSTEEEIRRANRRIREVYGKGALVVGGLYNKPRLDDLHTRIDEAYETLMDPAKRKAYDQALFPGGVPPRPSEDRELTPSGGVTSVDDAEPAEPGRPRPVRPVIAADTVYTGALLRTIRESMGVDLRAIAEETKIGIGYLQAIEDELFVKLPAVVYVRGFLVHYGRILQVDVERLLATYLERYRTARAELDVEAAPRASRGGENAN